MKWVTFLYIPIVTEVNETILTPFFWLKWLRDEKYHVRNSQMSLISGLLQR
jgi:hypothetical protein